MNWTAFIVICAVQLISITVSTVKHGDKYEEPIDGYSFWRALLKTAIFWGFVYWLGLFDNVTNPLT